MFNKLLQFAVTCVLLLVAQSASAQFNMTITHLGNAATGSWYKVVVSYNHVWYTPGNPGYGSGFSGIAGAIKHNGSFVGGNQYAVENNSAGNPLVESAVNFDQDYLVPTGVVAIWVTATRPIGSSTYTTYDTEMGTGTSGSYVYGEARKVLNYSITNTRDYPIRYGVFGVGDELLELIDVAPGATVTGQVTGAEGQVFTEKVFVPANFSDGGWVPADLDDGDAIPLPAIPSASVGSYVTPAVPPTTPSHTAVIPSGSIPSSGTITPTSGGTIWTPTANTVDNERLDKATYRAGVDKTVAALDKISTTLKTTTVTEPTTTEGDAPEPMEATELPVAEVTNMFPTTPDMPTGSFTSVSEISVNLTIPGIGPIPDIPISWEYDLAQHSGVITLIRDLLKYLLVWGFFIACVKTGRGAFADQPS